MTLDELNRLDKHAFAKALGGIYEHSPWVAAGAAGKRPFASVDALAAALAAVVAGANEARQLALIRAHPELAGKALVRKELTAESTGEQAGAGLTDCSPAEFARLADLNRRYNVKFGFPFILAVKGYDRAGVIAEFARRVEHDRATEFAENLRQIDRIARMRLATIS
ncbi:MAG TPA: 2-oxo-4-hydroxy-4-carboxy-5-ureidoimidazoline decarboxylase [Casimicrobiaceae bacterium]|nr:2-oxo-4-hydroxy-4-carboxy-5-ureidoimidazoline decarboxylase [Casimicrobiaceae bacterium]